MTDFTHFYTAYAFRYSGYVKAPSTLFQALLTLHFIGLAFGLGGMTITDFSFFRSIRKADKISPETVAWMRSFSVVVWLGVGLLAVSGVGLFLLDPSKYLHSTGFLVKMLLVLVLIINALFLNFYSAARLTIFNFSRAQKHHGAAWRARNLSFIFGAISAVTWYSILIIAMFKSMIHLSFFGYIAIYLTVLGIAIAGGLLLERYLFSRTQPLQEPQALEQLPISALASHSPKEYADNLSAANNTLPVAITAELDSHPKL